MAEEWEAVLIFVDESESFVLGFEGGRIWAALKENEDAQMFTIHGGNAELMLRIAESTGRALTWAETTDPLWSTAFFGPQPAEK